MLRAPNRCKIHGRRVSSGYNARSIEIVPIVTKTLEKSSAQPLDQQIIPYWRYNTSFLKATRRVAGSRHCPCVWPKRRRSLYLRVLPWPEGVGQSGSVCGPGGRSRWRYCLGPCPLRSIRVSPLLLPQHRHPTVAEVDGITVLIVLFGANREPCLIPR